MSEDQDSADQSISTRLEAIAQKADVVPAPAEALDALIARIRKHLDGQYLAATNDYEYLTDELDEVERDFEESRDSPFHESESA